MTDTNAISPVGSAHAEAVRVWESDPEYAAEQARLELANRIAFMTATRRTQLGLTQKELARRIGLSHTAISRLESGIHRVARHPHARLRRARHHDDRTCGVVRRRVQRAFGGQSRRVRAHRLRGNLPSAEKPAGLGRADLTQVGGIVARGAAVHAHEGHHDLLLLDATRTAGPVAPRAVMRTPFAHYEFVLRKRA